MKTKLISTITCPECGHKKEETMPTDACQFFYECENCKKVLRPLDGDCCVYCSYEMWLAHQFKKRKTVVVKK